MSTAAQAADRTLIALISDEDTATGLLLAGIGHIAAPARSGNEGGHSTTGQARQGNSTGALLGGEGDKAAEVTLQCRERNFFIVGSTTGIAEIEAAFQAFTQERGDLAILLITQPLAEKIRHVVDRYTQAFPAVLEIPSKDAPYGAL